MDILTTIIVSTIAGLAVLAIAGICKWFFSKKETKHETQPAPKVKKPTRNKSDDITATASGQGNVVIGKAGDVHIKPSNSEMKMPYEDFQRRIELERNEAVDDYKKASGDEKLELSIKIKELERRLADVPKAFEEAQAQIAELKIKLEREGNEIGAEKLAVAITALEQGDFSKADELFTEIEVREQLAVERAARAAYARGQIAEQEVRWFDAAEHYTRAAHLNSCFETLIKAHELAYNTGNYNSAVSFNKEAKKAAIIEYGEESHQHAATINDLAVLYRKNGQYKKSEKFHQDALKLRKKIFGEGHGAVAQSLNNLALIYDGQKQYKKAAKLYKESLIINQEEFGTNHPYTATSLCNLATVYISQGKYKESEKLHKEALKIRQKLFGDKHPNIANSLNNLGGLYYIQGQYEKAEPFCRQALEITETTLGFDHPTTKLFRQNYEDLQKDLPNAPKTTPK